MFKEFEKHLDKKNPFLKDSSLLVAVSGGIDSTVLAFLLNRIKMNCTLAHCNFKLRNEESNLDENFVKEMGYLLKFPVFTTSFETQKHASENGISIQMAARNLRYNWFQKLLKDLSLDYILTAHNKEDVLETFLINFTRGTGINGLLGIPEINGKIIRPLLIFSREQILQYAIKNNIKWREDESNNSVKYFRNKIRHTVIPVLKELNPNFLKSFDKTLSNLNESQYLIDCGTLHFKKKSFYHDTKGNIKISIRKNSKLKKPEINLYEILKYYGFKSSRDIKNLLKSQTGKQLFSKTHKLLKNRDELILTKLKNNKYNEHIICKKTKKIDVPISLKFSELNYTEVNSIKDFDENTACIDKKILKFPLIIRKWNAGDYFYPIGMKGKKKLSKYFKDEKLSLFEKENIWLLCSSDEIVWIIGKRLNDRYKITHKTKSILKITFYNK